MPKLKNTTGVREKESGDDLKRMAHLLDESIHLPFGIKIGWDGLLGLIPGIGDFITSALSMYIIFRSAQLGAGWGSLFRMVLNVFVEFLIGQIPFFGDLFDFYWKSNKKNIYILNQVQKKKESRHQTDKRYLTLVLCFLLLCFLGLAFLAAWMVLRFYESVKIF